MFIKINIASEHEEPSGDQLLAPPDWGGEPGAGDGSGALGSDVVAALCHLAEVIDQRLQFGSLCGEEWGIEMRGVRRRVGAA